MIIPPVSVVIGPGGTESFDARAVFGQQHTLCPGSGTRGGLLLPNVISCIRLEPS